jgi:hypothetical protein
MCGFPVGVTDKAVAVQRYCKPLNGKKRQTIGDIRCITDGYLFKDKFMFYCFYFLFCRGRATFSTD